MWHWNYTVNTTASCEAKSSCGLNFQQNQLFRRIPLGILIGCLNHIDEDGCQMLLHYAATGRIPQSIENKSTKLKHVKWSSVGLEESVSWTDKWNKRVAVAGACLVFSLTDAVESSSVSLHLFETEESGLQFIFRLKLRACKCLINCIKRLIQFGIDEDGIMMLMDLSSNSLTHKLSSL